MILEFSKEKPLLNERWTAANKHVLWGWKRDTASKSRVVYFSADLDKSEERLVIGRAYFFWRSDMPLSEAETIRQYVEGVQRSADEYFGKFSFSIDRANNGNVRAKMQFGVPTAGDDDKVSRLVKRRPRRKILPGDFPPSEETLDIKRLFPADVYVGSGMSYECNLPTLCDMHNRFCLDDYERNTFIVGERDHLPKWLSQDFLKTIRSFCDVHVGALSEPIAESYLLLKRMHSEGLVRKIFTDNVDNMFSVLGIPYERTRGSGVFNEPHEAKFASDNLIVIGVAADRRSIIEQFRKKRRPIVIVNPCANVSPGVQHLNYVRNTDIFYKTPAQSFFRSAALELDRMNLADE